MNVYLHKIKFIDKLYNRQLVAATATQKKRYTLNCCKLINLLYTDNYF